MKTAPKPLEDRIDQANGEGELAAQLGLPNSNPYLPGSPEAVAWQSSYDATGPANPPAVEVTPPAGLLAKGADTVKFLPTRTHAGDLPGEFPPLPVEGAWTRMKLGDIDPWPKYAEGSVRHVKPGTTVAPEMTNPNPTRYKDASGRPILNEAFLLGLEDFRLGREWGVNPFGFGQHKNAELSAAWERGWTHGAREANPPKKEPEPLTLKVSELIRPERVTREAVALAVLPFFLERADKVNTDMGPEHWAVFRAFGVADLFMSKAGEK